MRKVGEGDETIDASDSKIKGNIVGSMPSIICDRNGKEIEHVTVQDVVHSPEAEFNLFSITKRLKDGWKLGGDANAIWIYKGH